MPDASEVEFAAMLREDNQLDETYLRFGEREHIDLPVEAAQPLSPMKMDRIHTWDPIGPVTILSLIECMHACNVALYIVIRDW